MRPRARLRKVRLIYAGASALILSIPATAVAFSGGTTPLPTLTETAAPTLRAAAVQRRISYGQKVTMIGSTSSSAAGQSMWLEFAPSASSSWRALASATVAPSGRFRLAAPIRQSGIVRVIAATSAGATTAAAIAPSPAVHVAVAAELQVSARSLGSLTGQPIDVRGKLLPAVAARRLLLQSRLGGGWRTLTSSLTGPRGGFDLHYLPVGTGQQSLRVRFAGDSKNTAVGEPVGQLIVYTTSVASWYEDAGGTACGFHAYFGVANKTLPCGTKVEFRDNGRSVTAVVDDRGPFVAGREWDLNQNTAAALGFDGVATVWSSL